MDADLFDKFPQPLRAAMADLGTTKQYRPGQVMLLPGDDGDLVRVLLSGEAALMLSDEGDAPIAVEKLQPGDMFGEISFLTGTPAPSDTEVIAEESCTVIEIPSRDFENLLTDYPALAMSLVKNLARKIMRLNRSVMKSKSRRRALQSLISREEHVFPDYVVGEYMRSYLSAEIEALALSDGPVLIVGETGVGKEVVGYAIYRISHQCKGMFLMLDLLRSRSEADFAILAHDGPRLGGDLNLEQLRLFFGVEEMTDQGSKINPGYIELTEDGTLLVRGIDQLTVDVQKRLLETVTTGNFCRHGSDLPHKAGVRLIATTDLDPELITPENHPLLHGLMNRSIVIPPLRKRRREIPALVDHYVNKYCQELHKKIEELPQDTLKTLVNYSWPGNDMELSTTLKRAILVSEGGVLRPQDIYFDLKRVEGEGKFNLLRFKTIKKALQSPLFPAVFQSAVTPFFFIIIALLILGPADPMKNPAALFSWAVGWPMLIVGALLWSRFWCSLCPIGTISKLAKKIVSLEKPFPQVLKNHSDFFIAGAVLFIIWFETATNIRQSPFNVAMLLLIMLVSAISVAVVFERQSWCRYLCGLGGMISVLAKASPLELRADRNVCISHCTSNECYLGTADQEGCPFGIVAPKLHSNRFCKLCGVCVKLCPHDAINLNIRKPGEEIWEMRHTNTGTAFLIIGLIGGILSEMVSKMPIYREFTASWPLPDIGKFTVVYLLILVGVNLMPLLATAISHRIFDDDFQENYARYGLALLPIALTGFLAFHVYYLINLGVQLPKLISKNFDFEIFRHLIIEVPPNVTHAIQYWIIVIGLIWTLYIMYKIGRAGHERLRTSIIGALPHMAVAVTTSSVLIYAVRHFFHQV